MKIMIFNHHSPKYCNRDIHLQTITQKVTDWVGEVAVHHHHHIASYCNHNIHLQTIAEEVTDWVGEVAIENHDLWVLFTLFPNELTTH